MSLGKHGWRGGPENGRCPAWEDRRVRDDHASSKRRERVKQVRCSRPRDHAGRCAWRGVSFGVFA